MWVIPIMPCMKVAFAPNFRQTRFDLLIHILVLSGSESVVQIKNIIQSCGFGVQNFQSCVIRILFARTASQVGIMVLNCSFFSTILSFEYVTADKRWSCVLALPSVKYRRLSESPSVGSRLDFGSFGMQLKNHEMKCNHLSRTFEISLRN